MSWICNIRGVENINKEEEEKAKREECVVRKHYYFMDKKCLLLYVLHRFIYLWPLMGRTMLKETFASPVSTVDFNHRTRVASVILLHLIKNVFFFKYIKGFFFLIKLPKDPISIKKFRFAHKILLQSSSFFLFGLLCMHF